LVLSCQRDKDILNSGIILKSENLNNFFYWFKHNFSVFCGIMLLGYIGTLLNIPPSTASPIWPPAGLALAAMLVYGKVIIPGLFLGSFLVNTYSFLIFSTVESLAPAFITAAVSSLGLSLQASLGAYLVNKYLGKDNPLIEDSKIIYFFVLAAPVSCLTSATVGIIAIFIQGYLSIEDFLLSWLTWWLGDCIGVIIFTPIILAFIAKPKTLWKVRRKLVSYPLLCLFIVVVSMFQYNQKQETTRIASVFERQVNKFHWLLSNEILQHVKTNQVLKSFYDSSQFITEKEFELFTRPFITNKQNIQALEWISYVTSEHRKEYEQAESGKKIILELTQQNEMKPAKEKAEYFPVTYVQPLDTNQQAIGFDIGANPIALKAILEAKETAETVVSDPVQLIQDLDKKMGFVLYSPVFHKNKFDGKNNNLKGFTATVFSIDDEIKNIEIEFPDVHLNIKIHQKNKKLYSNFIETKVTELNLFSLQNTKQIEVANHIWTITYQPSADFYHNQLSLTIWWIFLGGFIITGLTAIGLLMLSGRTLRTEELVRRRTKDLAKSEERWQFALEGNRQGVWDWNVLSNEVFFSTSWKEMLGYKESEIGNSLDDWDKRLHIDDKEQSYFKLERHFNGIIPFYENEHRMLCKDGSYKWTMGRGMVVSWTNDHKPLRMIGTMTDITEQKKAKEALELSEELFRTMFEEAPLGVALIDSLNGKIYQVNTRFAEISGRTRGEMHYIDWMSIIHPDDVQEDLDNMALLNAGKIPGFNMITRYQHPDGVYVWVNMTIAPMTVVDKNCPRHLCMIADISEQRQTEEALRRAQKMDAVGQLTGGIAHDFNNILNIILGNIELLNHSLVVDEKAQKRLNTISKSAKRAATLTKQLLGFTRQKAVQVIRTDLNKVISEMDNMIARSVTPEVDVQYLLTDNLWLTEIDQGDFEDALLNLIINARDAMGGRGKLILETENRILDTKYCTLNPDVNPGDYVQLAISDNGEGMSSEQQEHIFEPFFTTKLQGQGTGLGLSMVFGFCQRSKGLIKVYSEPGIGTTFRLYLPRLKAGEQELETNSIEGEVLPKGSETILVVDDEEELLELIQFSLESQGYKVVTAVNGKQALEHLRIEPNIDLLFSDVVMPGGMNGYELAEQASVINTNLKVLLTSGFTQKGLAVNGQARFDANLLSKPYTQAEVVLKVRALLDEQ
jgi:PAS domain S-box-containing protein